jgi:hypothetical protein
MRPSCKASAPSWQVEIEDNLRRGAVPYGYRMLSITRLRDVTDVQKRPTSCQKLDTGYTS